MFMMKKRTGHTVKRTANKALKWHPGLHCDIHSPHALGGFTVTGGRVMDWPSYSIHHRGLAVRVSCFKPRIPLRWLRPHAMQLPLFPDYRRVIVPGQV